MSELTQQLPDRIAFIADAHLGLPGETPDHVIRVASFLRSLQGQVSHLYIVGDLFDYWFEYGSVVPTTAPEVVFELYNLTQSGTDITIFGGNHDYWLGSYLRDGVGLTIAQDGLIVEHQGRTIFMHHGDGLYPRDYGYKILKKVLRSPLSIFLFGLLHPSLAQRIASMTSKTSRSYLAPSTDKDYHKNLFRDIADDRLDDSFDAVIYGHSHVPFIEKRENGTLILLGDWIKHDSYVILEDGEFTLHFRKDSTEEKNG